MSSDSEAPDIMTGHASAIKQPSMLMVAAFTLLYLYIACSLACLASGLPVLILLALVQLLNLRNVEYRSALLGAVSLHAIYSLAKPSVPLYLCFAASCWTASMVLALVQFPCIRRHLRPIQTFIRQHVTRFEECIERYKWPLLNIHEHGYLAFPGGVTVDVFDGSITITDIDFQFKVDEHSTILAKVDTVRIRLARDIALGAVSVNLRGDGHSIEMLEPRIKPLSRKTTASSESAAQSKGDTEARKLPPAPTPELLSRHILLKNASTNKVSTESSRVPPVLPPRRPVPALPVDDAGDAEEKELQQAIKESLKEAGPIESSNASTGAKSARVSFEEGREELRNAPSGIDSELQSLYPQEEDAESDAYFRQVLEDNAVEHKVKVTTLPIEPNDLDTKAAFASQLQDKLEETLRATKEEEAPQIKLRQLVQRIPWWLKLTPGPLLTRLILSPLVWMHPIKVKTVAVSGTGKRITNILERCGITRAHPDPEVFRLVRKVFLWLERGDVSVILTNVQIDGYVPLARDPVAAAEIRADRPTAFRNTAGEEDLLAQLDAIKGTVKIPTYLLPNHAAYLPTTPRGKFLYSVLVSMPAVFNKELLIIGAAFLKAATMIDMKQDAAKRGPPTVHLNGNFSLRGLGTSLRQAAGDIAKQKGVQWGIGSERLAKYVNKISKWMRTIHMDVGGQGEVEFDLVPMRRRRDEKTV